MHALIVVLGLMLCYALVYLLRALIDRAAIRRSRHEPRRTPAGDTSRETSDIYDLVDAIIQDTNRTHVKPEISEREFCGRLAGRHGPAVPFEVIARLYEAVDRCLRDDKGTTLCASKDEMVDYDGRQFRIRIRAAPRYRLGGQGTLKVANAAESPSLWRSELDA